MKPGWLLVFLVFPKAIRSMESPDSLQNMIKQIQNPQGVQVNIGCACLIIQRSFLDKRARCKDKLPPYLLHYSAEEFDKYKKQRNLLRTQRCLQSLPSDGINYMHYCSNTQFADWEMQRALLLYAIQHPNQLQKPSIWSVSVSISDTVRQADVESRSRDNFCPCLIHLSPQRFELYLAERERANYSLNTGLYYYYLLNLPRKNDQIPRNQDQFFLEWQEARDAFINIFSSHQGFCSINDCEILSGLHFNRQVMPRPQQERLTPLTTDAQFRSQDHLPAYLLHLKSDEYKKYLDMRKKLILLNIKEIEGIPKLVLSGYMITCSDQDFIRWQQARTRLSPKKVFLWEVPDEVSKKRLNYL